MAWFGKVALRNYHAGDLEDYLEAKREQQLQEDLNEIGFKAEVRRYWEVCRSKMPFFLEMKAVRWDEFVKKKRLEATNSSTDMDGEEELRREFSEQIDEDFALYYRRVIAARGR